jgi:hypothetical protein
MKTRPLPVRAFLVVTTRCRVHKQVVHFHAMALLVVLPGPEEGQHVLGESRTGGVQRMPALFLGTGTDFPANDGANGLLGVLVLEHRLGFGQADLLGRGADAYARIFDRYEQAAGQWLPGAQAVRVATGAQGDIQQERPRVVRPCCEQGGGGSGTGWLGGTVSAGRGSAGVWPALGRGVVASARVARSRPNFLQKWCQATVETRTPQVRSMKSRMS